MLVTTSVVIVNLFLSENLPTNVAAFWVTSGTIYPNNLIVKALLTERSLLSDNSVVTGNESMCALNLKRSGSPQYASEAYCTASIILFNWSL
jgi:hypothetical protein